MAQSKRTFNQAKLERDLDDRIVPQGTYRDALNISVDTSEDANVGVIENMKGNELIANQNILGLSSSTNPNAKVIGSYSHPEENKIYYFVTGDNIDGIFEYDITNNEINTLLLDSTKPVVAKKTTFTFTMAGVTGSISQNGVINVLSGKGTAIAITPRFPANTSGSTKSVKIPVKVRVPRGYANYKTSGAYVTGSITANQPSITAPTPTTAAATNVSLTTATLNGELDNDDVNVTSQGFFFGYKSASNEALTVSELTNGGSGIVRSTVTSTGVNNDFNKDVTGIPNQKLVSFVAIATNSVGQGVATNVLTFTTSAAPANPPANRPHANRLYIHPVLGPDTGASGTDNDSKQVGYGPIIKSDNKIYYTVFGFTQSTGLYADQAVIMDQDSTFCISPPAAPGNTNCNTAMQTQLNLPSVSGPAVFNTTAAMSDNSFAATFGDVRFGSYESGSLATQTAGMYTITMSGRTGGLVENFTDATIQIKVGNPSGVTTFTSIIQPAFASTGTGTTPFLASGGTGATVFSYNQGNNGVSGRTSFSNIEIGPMEAGNKGIAIIPFQTVAPAVAGGSGNFGSFSGFDATKVAVSIAGKTAGVDYDFYIFDQAPVIYGTNPGIMIEADTSVLNGSGNSSVTHTVTITYNY